MTDVGCQRQNNEDHYSYWEPASGQDFERKGRLAIVADGMGGHEGGQEASHMAVETIQEIYSQQPGPDPQSLLDAGFLQAHERIRHHATEHPELTGMGTTATAAVLLDRRLYFAHIGDSRLYLVRGERISRLTHDHSYVGRLVDNGVISPEEAEAHPQRHILTAALGAGPEATFDAPGQPIALEPGDVLVLCTDGLWGLLTDQEIQQAVARKKPDDACQAMIATAKERGGPDNITVQVLRVG